MARPNQKKGRIHRGKTVTESKGTDCGSMDFKDIPSSVWIPPQDEDGLYLGKTVRVFAHRLSMRWDELPKKIQDGIIKLSDLPDDWVGEKLTGQLNLYISVPEAERAEEFRRPKKKQ